MDIQQKKKELLQVKEGKEIEKIRQCVENIEGLEDMVVGAEDEIKDIIIIIGRTEGDKPDTKKTK